MLIPFLCALALGVQEAPPTMPAELVRWRNVAYAQRGSRSLMMDMYRLRYPAVRPTPAVIFIHGGAWREGKKEQGNPILWELARRGMVGITIEYRLSTEARFPAQVEDAKAAVRFVRENAARFGIDPNQIGVMGSSAGGHLAALVAATSDGNRLADDPAAPLGAYSVQACTAMFSATDLVRLVEYRRLQLKQRPELVGENSPEAQLLGGSVYERLDLARQASPMTYVSPNCPPFLIVHGTLDETVPMTQSMLLHDALRQNGVRSDLKLLPGVGHVLRFDLVTEAVVDFFEATLGS